MCASTTWRKHPRPGPPAAQLDPWQRAPGVRTWSWKPGLTEQARGNCPPAEGLVGAYASDALEAVRALRAIYSATTGYDYEHVRIPEEREWLRDAIETGHFRPPNQPIDALALLERLTQVEAFESFLHRIFPGKHRFSIEGLDMMVPMLDEIICGAADSGTRSVLFGMAHRGRLNILAHVLQKPYAQILAEFKDPVQRRIFRDDLGWTGDVKYHKGAYWAAAGENYCDVAITMPPNPSHLEAVNAVLEGMARAAGTFVDEPTPRFDPL